MARFLAWLIRGYQTLFAGRPSPCRYVPTCSPYALEAIEAHGAARGAWLATRRLLRCHPFASHGYDPVPPRKATEMSNGHDAASSPRKAQ